MGRQVSVKKVMADRVKAEKFIKRGLDLLLSTSRILEEVLMTVVKEKKNGLSEEIKKRIVELDKLGGGNASSAIIASSVSKEFRKIIKPKQVTMYLAHQKDPTLAGKIQAGRTGFKRRG